MNTRFPKSQSDSSKSCMIFTSAIIALCIVCCDASAEIPAKLVNYAEMLSSHEPPDHRLSAVPFSYLCDDELITCITDQSAPSVSLRAAWERVLRAASPPESIESSTRISRSDSGQFIGFVEGRLAIPLPSWWRRAVRNAELTIVDGSVVSVVSVINCPRPPTQSIGEAFADEALVNREVKTLTLRDKSLEVHFRGDPRTYSLTLPPSMLREFKHRFHIEKAGQLVFVAVPDALPESYILGCFDADSSKFMWQSHIWAARTAGGSGPRLFNHAIDMIAQNSTIYLVGAGNDAFYIEGFDMESGAVNLRFSSK